MNVVQPFSDLSTFGVLAAGACLIGVGMLFLMLGMLIWKNRR